jgi:hypothetical protein
MRPEASAGSAPYWYFNHPSYAINIPTATTRLQCQSYHHIRRAASLNVVTRSVCQELSKSINVFFNKKKNKTLLVYKMNIVIEESKATVETYAYGRGRGVSGKTG